MRSFTARAIRSGRWWAITVDEAPRPQTQARRLDQVEAATFCVLADAVVLDVGTISHRVRRHRVLDIPTLGHRLTPCELKHQAPRGLRNQKACTCWERSRLMVRNLPKSRRPSKQPWPRSPTRVSAWTQPRRRSNAVDRQRSKRYVRIWKWCPWWSLSFGCR
jgi:hypothetical protein